MSRPFHGTYRSPLGERHGVQKGVVEAGAHVHRLGLVERKDQDGLSGHVLERHPVELVETHPIGQVAALGVEAREIDGDADMRAKARSLRISSRSNTRPSG